MFPIRDHNPSGRTPFVTYTLIAINIVVFLASLQYESSPRAMMAFYADYALIPRFLSEGYGFSGLFTSMFLHGGWMHIAGNMLFLYIFGDNLEDEMGHVGYLLFYLAAGICSHVSNGSQIGRQALARLMLQSLQAPGDTQLAALRGDLQTLGSAPGEWWELPADTPSEIGELVLTRDGVRLRLAVLVSAFGALTEDNDLGWRIVTYLPLDAATRTSFHMADSSPAMTPAD